MALNKSLIDELKLMLVSPVTDPPPTLPLPEAAPQPKVLGSFPKAGTTDLVVRARGNEAFRRVIRTSGSSQIALMSIPPGGEVGAEVHKDIEQMFVCVSGKGRAVIGGKTSPVTSGHALVVRPGTEHNLLNTGTEPLKLYTIYVPPNHPPDTLHMTKADADAAEGNKPEEKEEETTATADTE